MAESQDVSAPEAKTGRDLLPLVRTLENSGDAARSPVGALGRYQIMPGTARQYGFDPKRLLDPAYNEQVASAVLDDLHRRFNGRIQDILVGYNAGPGAANKWIAGGRKLNALPSETQGYITRASTMVQGGGLSGPIAPETPKDADTPPPSEPSVAPGQAEIAKLRAGGFTDTQIGAWQQQRTEKLMGAGYKPEEVSNYWGQKTPDSTPVDKHLTENIARASMNHAPKLADSALESLAAGWDMSVTGLSNAQHLPDTVMPEHAPIFNRIMAGTGQALGDFPYMLMGGAAGAVAGSEVPVVGTVAGAGAGALMLPQAMREIMLITYRAGDVHSAADFLGMAGKSLLNIGTEGVKGGASAFVGGKAGLAALELGGSKIAGGAANVLGQAVTYTGLSGAFEGKVPDKEDFAAGIVMGLTMHAATGGFKVSPEGVKEASKNTEEIYAQTGTPPWDAAAKGQRDVVYRQELLQQDVNGDPVFPNFRKDAPNEPPPYEPTPPVKFEPPPPPPGGEGGPGAVGGDQPKIDLDPTMKQTTAELHETMQEMYGAPPAPENPFSIARNYRGWVSELAPARAFDDMLVAQGASREQHMLLEDMLRQTYASETRAGVYVRYGGIDPITLNVKKNVPSIIDAAKLAKENGGDLQGWQDWMVTKRSLEKTAQGYETGHPLSPEQQQQLVTDGAPKYEAATASLQKTLDDALAYGRDSNVFSQDQIDRMKAANPTYISYRRISGDDTTVPEAKVKGRGFRVREPVGRFEGSDRKILSPLIATIDNVHMIVKMADRNRAIGAVVTLAERNGQLADTLGLKRIAAPEIKATIAEPGSDVFTPYNLDGAEAKAFEPVVAQRAARTGLKENQFMYIRDGKPEIWQAKSPELATLLRGADSPGQAEMFGTIATKVAALQRTGITAPLDFPLRNVFRDQIQAFILDPLHPPPFVTWMRGAMDAFGGGEHFQNWVARGGAGSFLGEMDNNRLAMDLHKIFEETGTWDRLYNVATPRNWPATSRMIGERMDAASRIGYTKYAESQGVEPVKAATMGRKAVLDFAEKGAFQVAQGMARITPFFRPNMLGLKQQIEGFATPEKAGRASLAALAAITLPTIILNALNYMQDEHLPEGERSTEISHYYRDNMYIFPQVNGVRMKLPYPPGLGFVFGGVVTRFMDWLAKDDPKAFKDWTGSLMGQFLPPLIPAIALPPLQWVTNHNFFTGHPLIPASLEGASGPMQYQPYTTEAAKGVANAIAAIGGDVSPINIENVVSGYFGTAGMMALKALNAPLLPNDPRPHELADNPFVGSFFIRQPGMSAQSIQDFYDEKKKVEQLATDKRIAFSRMLGGTKNGEAEFNQAMAKYEGMERVAANAAKTMRIMNSAIEGIRNAPLIEQDAYDKMTPAERANSTAMTKDDKLRAIDEQMTTMIQIAKSSTKLLSDQRAQDGR